MGFVVCGQVVKSLAHLSRTTHLCRDFTSCPQSCQGARWEGPASQLPRRHPLCSGAFHGVPGGELEKMLQHFFDPLPLPTYTRIGTLFLAKPGLSTLEFLS